MCKIKNGIFPCGLWAFSSRLTYYILVVYGKHTKQVAEAGSVSHMAFNYFCAKLITEMYSSIDLWSSSECWCFFPFCLGCCLLVIWFYLTYLSGQEGWFPAEKPHCCRETCGWVCTTDWATRRPNFYHHSRRKVSFMLLCS